LTKFELKRRIVVKKIKSFSAFVIAVVLVITSFASVLTCAANFSDVSGDGKYSEYINDLAQKGIVKGYSEDSFGTEDICTREQFITFLYRASGSPEVTNKASFTDVAEDAYYADAISWGYENKIIKAFEDGTIGIGKSVDRAHAASFLYAWGKLINKADNRNGAVLADYTDAADVPLYARTAFAWAVSRNLFETADGALSPLSDVTRGWTAFAVSDILSKHICIWSECKDNGDGTHTNICTADNGHEEIAGHTFNNGELTVAPTTTQDGVITYTCTECLSTKTEVAPKGTQYVTRKDLENAIVQTGWAYYAKGPKAQYDGRHVTWLTGYVGGTARFTAKQPPEYATEDTNFYTVCSTYTHETYYESLGIESMGERTTPFGLSTAQHIYCAENQQERHTSKAKINEPLTDNDVDMVLFKWIDFDHYKEKESKNAFQELVAFDFFTSDHFTEYTDDIVFVDDSYDGDIHYSYYDNAGNKLDPQVVLQEYIVKTAEQYEKYMRPGDVFASTDHTMMYVGGRYSLHSSYSTGGGKIQNTYDKVEPDGTVFAQENLISTHLSPEKTKRRHFVILRPLNRVVAPGYDEDPGNDIVKGIEIPEKTLTREEYPMMDIDRTVDITPYGTVSTGENLTYTIKIFNESNNKNYLKWGSQYEHGTREAVTYKNLIVTETIPEGTELVESSLSEGAKVEGNKIVWNIESIVPGESVELTYSVKVIAPAGSYIVNDGGFVNNIPSNSIKNTVGGAKLTEEQKAALASVSAGGIEGLKDYGKDTDFAEAIYAKMGKELSLPTTLELATNLFRPETFVPGNGPQGDGDMHPGVFTEITVFTLENNVSEEYKPYKAMLADRLYGGLSFYVGEEQKWNFATKSVLDFRPEFLEEGDILIYFATPGNARTIEAFSNEYEKVVVAVYDGEKLLRSTGSSNAETTYEIIEEADVYAALQAYIASPDKQLFFVLRPSQMNQ